MIRRLVARGLLSVVLAAALFSLFRLPAGAATVYQEITGMEELTSGQYVLVTPLGDAPGILLGEDFVISATKPTFTGDTVAAGAEWNLTVTENRVILTDAHGVSAAPLEGDRNGIAAGTYEWQVLWDGKYFSFHGCNGSEPVTLDTVCGHVLHFLELGGGKHIALGGDLDGCESLPRGFEGPQDYPKLAQALLARGVEESVIEDMFWNNAMRVFQVCCM